MPEQKSRLRSPTRRGLLSAMLAAPLLPPSSAIAGPSQNDVPTFRSPTGQLTLEEPRWRVGPLRLVDLDGKATPVELGRGRPSLLCFWATWCPPCRHELPMLEGLQVEYPRLVDVRPIAIDREGARLVAPFLTKIGVRRLSSFVDPQGSLAKPVGSVREAPFVLWGMPLTYIIDRKGFVAAWFSGEADWTSPEGLAVLRHFAAE